MNNNKSNGHLTLLTEAAEELAHITGSTDVRGFLKKIAEKISKHLNTAVCSIYLFNEKSKELVLEANIGLKPKNLSEIRMSINEGLVGKVFRETKHLATDKASRHPDYRYFPDAGEERYDCFLAVPVMRGAEKIGVLAVQRETPHKFTDGEIAVIRALASQLAGAISQAKAFLGIQDKSKSTASIIQKSAVIRGKGACAGGSLGHSFSFKRKSNLANVINSPGKGVKEEIDAAFNRTMEQLSEMQSNLKERLPEAAALIFEAHRMMLQDTGFRDKIYKKIDEGFSNSAAVAMVAKKYIDIFEANEHEYMREKAKDIEDLVLRVLGNLHNESGEQKDEYSGRIIIAAELLPSDMMMLALENIGGIVLAGGGLTSHVAILSRSLQIPMAIVNTQELLQLENGTLLGLDGDTGIVYINPEKNVKDKLSDRLLVEKTIKSEADSMKQETATSDGIRIRLMANINLLAEINLAIRLKAEGIGLYRTEFPFLIRSSFPTCEEQVLIYKHLFDKMPGREITFRTLDAGGDKMLSYFDISGEANPELGLRSTRFTLSHPEVFEDQLRAILRVWDHSSQLRIMFPMISSPDEFINAKEKLKECMALENITDSEKISIGMMLELPAVAEMMDEFIQLADFFSIGTNDFVQYMLAVDRTNEKVSDYYCPHHPSVLRALKRVAGHAVSAGKDISVCGEMAHDLRYIPFFIGIGIRKLSVDPRWLPAVQRTINNLSLKDAETYANELLKATSVNKAQRLLRNF